jgi:hypothetical protein
VVVLTLAGECREKVAAAASNSGRPGAGMAHRCYRVSDSSASRVLPKLYRNCSAVRETAWCTALANLGQALRDAGHVQEAVTAYRKAAAAFRESDDPDSEHDTLRSLEQAQAGD